MNNSTLKYIGKVNVANLREFILSSSIAENESIFIHPHTYDEFALDYRSHYSEGLSMPFIYLGIKICPDSSGRVPIERVMVSEGTETGRLRIIDLPTDNPYDEIIYRCGWCGNVVKEDGSEFSYDERLSKIKTLETNKCKEVSVNGDCCIDKM